VLKLLEDIFANCFFFYDVWNMKLLHKRNFQLPQYKYLLFINVFIHVVLEIEIAMIVVSS